MSIKIISECSMITPVNVGIGRGLVCHASGPEYVMLGTPFVESLGKPSWLQIVLFTTEAEKDICWWRKIAIQHGMLSS